MLYWVTQLPPSHPSIPSPATPLQTRNYKSLKLWNCDNHHLKRKYNSASWVLKGFFLLILILFLSLYYGNTISQYLFHTRFTYLSASGGEKEVFKENDKMMFNFIIFYLIKIPIRCVLSNLAKWSFKGLLLRIYLKYPGKVTISYCTLYFHISNSISTEKKMHNVLGQDIKNLLLDQCIQKRSLR